MKNPEEVFLVTQYNPKPSFYSPAVSTKLMTRKAMTMKLAAWKKSDRSFTVLRAPVGDWEDVTKEFTNGHEPEC